ncbi:MAG TPA: LPS assembly protein LptD, partial [Candidatus Polarisedimenticolia bacterium]|nr:LPS assembly protein LptD [Candidatus Polarisedimenticolia bacterium]
ATPQPQEEKHIVQPGPGGTSMEIAAGPGSIIGKDELILKGYVDIKFGDARLQADYVRYLPATKEAYAEGNVILDHGETRITAESLVYNLETETGIFYKARGYAEPSYYFEAERVEKISKDELVLHDATFTACTQPIPYWSFRVGRGLLRLDNYAYLHNLSFRVGRVPVFYTPYLVWPIKTDRASGLLFPEFGFSRRGGTVISNAWYWAMRRNMDATFHLDYLSLAGYGQGVEYRYVPSQTGEGYFTGYFIRDQVAKHEQRSGVPVDRWVIDYGHHQEFDSGWRLVANANLVSDFNYYLDFERDIRLSTNPQAVSNLYLTRNWGFYSVNVRGERREQLVNVPILPSAYGEPFLQSQEESIVRLIEPEVELRGRRQRLGKTPFFLTLESSFDSFDLGRDGAAYRRFDLFPVFSSQLSPVPWLDVDANLGYRETSYSKTQRGDLGCDNKPNTGDYGEGNGVLDGERDNPDPVTGQYGTFGPEDDLGCDNLPGTGDYGEGNGVRDQEQTLLFDNPFNRSVYQAGLTLIGPKLSRVFNTPRSGFSPQYKNTFEPTLRYTYISAIQDPERIIPFDEIDAIGGSRNILTYSLVTRLFAKRPAGQDEELLSGAGLPGLSTSYVGGNDPLAQVREAIRKDQERRRREEGAGAAPAPEEEQEGARKQLSTVEVATLEISQDYSFLGPLSTSLALHESRPVSPIRASLRYNPSLRTSVDLRTSFDVLFRDFRDASLSANLRSPRYGFLDLTWSLVRDLEGKALLAQGLAFTQPFDRNQIGFQGETSLFGRKVLFGVQANYEIGDVLPGEPRLRDQRYKFGYNTQCCGVQLEVLNRNFLGASQQEFRFLINLKGVGNVIDLNAGPGTGF